MNDFDYDIFDDMEEMSPMYDDAYMPSTNLWYEEEYMDEGVKVGELLELCIEPTVRDGFSHVGKLLLWCFLFRASTQIVTIPTLACHIVSSGTGLLILHHFFRSTMYYILGFAVGAYLCLFLVSHLLKKHRGPIMGMASIAFLIVCELCFVNKTEWHKIRGAQMLVAMKVISVAFDTDFGALQCLPSPVEFTGYVLCVGTCVFGPWVPYRDYISIFNKPVWNTRWLWRIFTSILLAFLFLTVSTCWIHWLIPDGTWRCVPNNKASGQLRSHSFHICCELPASWTELPAGSRFTLTWSLYICGVCVASETCYSVRCLHSDRIYRKLHHMPVPW